jgi:hypothetical protein
MSYEIIENIKAFVVASDDNVGTMESVVMLFFFL